MMLRLSLKLVSNYYQNNLKSFKLLKIKNYQLNKYWKQYRSISSFTNNVLDDNDEESIDFRDELLKHNDNDDIFKYNLHQLQDLTRKNVMVIMPRMKYGGQQLYRSHDDAQLLLDETVQLVESIPYWKVIDSQIISTKSIQSQKIFGKTNLANLRDRVRDEAKPDAIVFAIDMLQPTQQYFFRNYLNCEIYDRYTTVLKIFRERCKTKESRLQLSLAELEYVRKNLHHLNENDFQQFQSISSTFNGNFDRYFREKKQLLDGLEQKLKKNLIKLAVSHEIKRKNRQSNHQIPIVAIVGYTNSGKTSLIKALSNDERLQPENRLFATLEITAHQITLLPSRMKVLLIDTIGFISDIPTTLIHCFRSTLQEICMANLIVHVFDQSNPNFARQIETVNETLKQINVPEKLLQTMLLVSNKIDKLSSEKLNQSIDHGYIPISATEKIGLKELTAQIESKLIENTDQLAFELRIPNGGEQYQWLYREATAIFDIRIDPNDSNYLLMRLLLSKSKLGKYLKLFPKSS